MTRHPEVRAERASKDVDERPHRIVRHPEVRAQRASKEAAEVPGRSPFEARRLCRRAPQGDGKNQNTSQPGRPQEISRSDGKLVMIWQPSLVTTTSSSMRAAPEPSSAPFHVSSANTMPSLSGVFCPV